MKICKYKSIRLCVLSLSMISILFYSARVCGISTIQAMAVPEENYPESDFSVKKNNNIQTAGGKENYIVVTEHTSKAKQIEKQYSDATTISEKSKNCMEKEKVAVCQMTGIQAKQLQDQEGVLRVERDTTVQANGMIQNRAVRKSRQSNLKKEWNMEMIRKDAAIKKKVSDKVKVAVIDSGVDFGNDVELRNYIDLVPGYEECPPYYIDITGHGSAVAGIIAAEENGKGITGISPNVELYSARVLDENNAAPTSRVIEAIYWAIEQDVNIINMSFGKLGNNLYADEIDELKKENIICVASAGNENMDAKNSSPASCNSTITVSALRRKMFYLHLSHRKQEYLGFACAFYC